MQTKQVVVFWFRRDLRLEDNHGLYEALKSSLPVLPLFIFDTEILDKLPSKKDARVEFIHRHLEKIHKVLNQQGSGLYVTKGKPVEIFRELLSKHKINTVYANKDYEPYALQRDEDVKELLQDNHADLKLFKDQVIFEESEVVKDDGKPYTVYTPFSRKWKAKLLEEPLSNFSSEKYLDKFIKQKGTFLSLQQIGFEPTGIKLPEPLLEDERLEKYQETRNIPALDSTTKTGVHLRFGTISVRKLVHLARQKSETYLNELIWREFFMQILFHFPQVETQNFNAKYDRVQWRNNEQDFKNWCEGKTGYPMVDAGMRELNATGFMHNRVRMLVASFLTKHLLIDWRWGEAYFAEKLLDYELASNNGNWQWAAGTGCDAAPYFRVFNPMEQHKKFDPHSEYLKKWVPEWQDFNYAQPIVDHKFARERAINSYKEALNYRT
ncbi:MAG: deoxyribodipyrimidine photo-lyase [Bacteroidales bacterium]|jgi:deoxyribodipyrimidine photo-lyase|nr:deoxyribodipyrimidine photo-lyase [Bacteroidales bacterium]